MSDRDSWAHLGEWTFADELQTMDFGAYLVKAAGREGTVLLVGDLGAGKTTCTKGIARLFGIAASMVQSPTYTLVNEYEGADGALLVHIDLYRLQPEDLPPLGLDEMLWGSGFKVVEWADRMGEVVSELVGAIWVELSIPCSGGRTVSAWRVQ